MLATILSLDIPVRTFNFPRESSLILTKTTETFYGQENFSGTQKNKLHCIFQKKCAEGVSG